MTPLPPVMNVNWYITCTPCKHYQFIDVAWFKEIREKYGKEKPLTWDRLICRKCRGRNIFLARTRPLTKQEYAKKLADDHEQKAQQDFERTSSKWSEDWDDNTRDFVDDTGWHLPGHVDADDVTIDDTCYD